MELCYGIQISMKRLGAEVGTVRLGMELCELDFRDSSIIIPVFVIFLRDFLKGLLLGFHLEALPWIRTKDKLEIGIEYDKIFKEPDFLKILLQRFGKRHPQNLSFSCLVLAGLLLIAVNEDERLKKIIYIWKSNETSSAERR